MVLKITQSRIRFTISVSKSHVGVLDEARNSACAQHTSHAEFRLEHFSQSESTQYQLLLKSAAHCCRMALPGA